MVTVCDHCGRVETCHLATVSSPKTGDVIASMVCERCRFEILGLRRKPRRLLDTRRA